jgi:hypothetical protein
LHRRASTQREDVVRNRPPYLADDVHADHPPNTLPSQHRHKGREADTPRRNIGTPLQYDGRIPASTQHLKPSYETAQYRAGKCADSSETMVPGGC